MSLESLSGLSESGLQSLIDAGSLPVELIKEIVERASAHVGGARSSSGGPGNPASPRCAGRSQRRSPRHGTRMLWVSSSPVAMKEIRQRQQELAECIAQEQWIRGFALGLSLLSTLGGAS